MTKFRKLFFAKQAVDWLHVHGLSYPEIAKRSGVKYATILAIKNGKSSGWPSADKFIPLLEEVQHTQEATKR